MKWGFDWAKAGSGLATFLIAGGITFGLWVMTGRIYLYVAAIAVIGFFVMLTGLMGEEGVW